MQEQQGTNVYSEKARELFAQLNLPPSGAASDSSRARHNYNDLDPVFQNPSTKARVYIGNITASSTRAILAKYDITCIVNCTDDLDNAFEDKKNPGRSKDGTLSYFRFDLYQCFSKDLSTNEAVLKFWTPVLKWVDAATAQGRSVLIHCLAGAHRAGTTGSAYVMYAAKLDRASAIKACKLCRPVVDPDGELERNLDRLYRAIASCDGELPDSLATAAPFAITSASSPLSSEGAESTSSRSGGGGGNLDEGPFSYCRCVVS